MLIDQETPFARQIDVYLNGEKLKHCIAADDKEGWAEVWDALIGTNRLHGDVHFVFELIDDGPSEDAMRNTIRTFVSDRLAVKVIGSPM